MTFALVLVRWLHLSASILMASLFLFEAVIFLPAARRTSVGTGRLLDTIHQLTCRIALWAFLVAFLSWFAWSWLATSIMTGDDLIECLQGGAWLTVLSRTQFGSIWLFRVIICLVLGIILWVLGHTSYRRSFLKTSLAGLSVIELVSLAWVGHAIASAGQFGVVHLFGDALHLLCSAFWPGALAPLAAFLFLLLKSGQVEDIELAAPVVRRFSASSVIAVAGIASTGLLNSFFLISNSQMLLTSAYGQILLSKLILFFAMIGIGAWNLCLLKPRITAEIPTTNLAPKSAVHLLLRNVLWEIGLGTAIILIVGLLGITPPPMR
jgi:putative copper resistance protein D